ncbi:hypothetical protein PFICI_02125 [Pestalotiopsis fici W106-1]|uniref:Zn(2)-C6 fungal-type domain-containing protein n=1 Tax=Pestalotiopsis fici (strain W106-1 / CGMCC3.15140) TaxID=1229662 RepID=W3XDG9_PESFW|nr:uncharacterized protein PFICI_02125 [Pestalotiopsis fici W106-1]ETS84100.1 hypothetical protein PFICI_02125 [Pestalotiopsis fici W106-1]
MAATIARGGITTPLDDQADHQQASVDPSHCQQDRTSMQYVALLPRTSVSQSQQRNAPSANMRQRVRRACLECRTKKVKCDGAETCSRCATYQIQCEYVEFNAPAFRNTNATDTSKMERLESRVAQMEQMFGQYLDQLQRIEDKLGTAPARRDTILGLQEITSPEGTSGGQGQTALIEEACPPHDTSVAQVSSPISDSRQCLDRPNADAEALDAQRTNEEIHDPEICTQGPLTKDKTPPEPQISLIGHDGSGRRYADGFGELDTDSHGQLRYIGLGSTVSVAVENCIGLRRYITKGLERKGYEAEESFFTSLEATHFDDTAGGLATQSAATFDLPPKDLVDALVCTYVKDLEYLFPIMAEHEIRLIHQRLMNGNTWDPGHAAVFYALLAVSIPLISADNVIFDTAGRHWLSAGPMFYNRAMHHVNMPSSKTAQRRGRRLDMVTALGLLSVYLAETGSQAEAWISIGRAIRIAQDIGLHRSSEKLRLPRDEWDRRSNTWWCLYILERQLCTALGRPLSINDEDCDTDMPSCGDGSRNMDVAGFTSMIHLYRIIGDILKVVNSVRNANSWCNAAINGKREELRVRVRDANDALHIWAKDMVPAHIKTAKSGKSLALKHVALSSFFSAVILLHRAFIRNPHRPSPLAGSWAQLKSAKAATDCIRGSTEFFECVSKTHFMVFHGQYVFVSALVLLSCARWSDDPRFVYQALRDVEDAMQVLQNLEASWKGAKKCQGTVEEYLEFTFQVLRGDRNCHFDDHDFGCPSHDTRKSVPAKRRASGGSGSGSAQKKSCFHGSSQQPEMAHAPAPSGNCTDEIGSQNPPLPGSQQANIPQTVSQEPCFFDNTINNFLGAMDSSMDIPSQLDFPLDIGFSSSGMAFPSPDHGQNSFF